VRWPALRSVAHRPCGLAVAGRSACLPDRRRVGLGADDQCAGDSGRGRSAGGVLVVTNVFSADATLQSVEVRGDGTRLLRLTGDALVEKL